MPAHPENDARVDRRAFDARIRGLRNIELYSNVLTLRLRPMNSHHRQLLLQVVSCRLEVAEPEHLSHSFPWRSIRSGQQPYISSRTLVTQSLTIQESIVAELAPQVSRLHQNVTHTLRAPRPGDFHPEPPPAEGV
jgi:hypothetical protein